MYLEMLFIFKLFFFFEVSQCFGSEENLKEPKHFKAIIGEEEAVCLNL